MNTGNVIEGPAIDALANQAESKARAWMDANGKTSEGTAATTGSSNSKKESTSESTARASSKSSESTKQSKSTTAAETAGESTSKKATGSTETTATQPGKTMQITSDNVKLRRGPATEYRQIAEISKGSKVEVIGKKNGWYQVKVNGKEGYVYGALVDAKSGDAYTTATVKSVAAVTDSDKKPVTAPKAGDKIVVLGGIHDGKYQVQLANGKVGYVDKNAIDVKVDAPQFVP
jgi:uncharacterized protein YraI